MRRSAPTIDRHAERADRPWAEPVPAWVHVEAGRDPASDVEAWGWGDASSRAQLRIRREAMESSDDEKARVVIDWGVGLNAVVERTAGPGGRWRELFAVTRARDGVEDEIVLRVVSVAGGEAPLQLQTSGDPSAVQSMLRQAARRAGTSTDELVGALRRVEMVASTAELVASAVSHFKAAKMSEEFV